METIIIIFLGLLIAEVTFLLYLATKRTPLIGGRKVYVDTSALMDGRIVTAARTGFIPDKLVIPASVVAELQFLADQADSDKRARARRGLDAITELQDVDGITVTILNDGPVGSGGVDARLVDLAKKDSSGLLCTIDFNLNKVATVNGVTVLNINELAGNIRMAFLPGESMSLALTQKGQSDDQAVGYLADGTMVVVDKAGKEVGKTVRIEFIRSLQTAAGRMMFARLVSKSAPAKTQSTNKSKIQVPSQIEKQPIKSNKGGGRKQITSQPSGAAAEKSNKRQYQANKKSTSSSREDSLLELVNNQQ